MSPTSVLKINLIGRFFASIDGREFLTRQSASWNLLAYVALSPNMTVSRSRLATHLWEASDELHARRNLRQVLYRMRAELEPKSYSLISKRETVGLDPKLIQTDVDAILQTLVRGNVPEILISTSQIHLKLLDQRNFYGEMSSSWVHMVRREFENRLHSKLEAILFSTDEHEAVRAARAMLSLDPADETAAAKLIEMYWLKGETGRALGTYSELWNYLDLEFDTEPGPATQDIIVRVKTESPPRKLSGSAIAGSGNPSSKIDICINPATMIALSEQEKATAGLFRADVISNLLKFRQFQIIDATFQKTSAKYRLELKFMPSDQRLGMSAVLSAESDGIVAWSDSFADIAGGWWKHQRVLAAKLATACATTISSTRLAQIEEQLVVQGALDNWLMGQSLSLSFRTDNLEETEKCFSTCMKLAPKSSLGFGAMSQFYNGLHLMHPDIRPSVERFRKSKALANTAISLDPLDTKAHLCRAWASCLLREFNQASAGFSMALECNPNDPWTVASSALGVAFSGDSKRASELIASFECNRWILIPQHWGYVAPIRFLSGDFSGCIEAAENCGDATQNINGWKAAAYWHLGEPNSAHAAWAKFISYVLANQKTAIVNENTFTIEWFLSCFPIRSSHSTDLLRQGIVGAAAYQRH